MSMVHPVDDGLSFVKRGPERNTSSTNLERSEMEVDVIRILMALLMVCVLAGSLTACGSSHMDPMSYGGDAPGDINSNHH